LPVDVARFPRYAAAQRSFSPDCACPGRVHQTPGKQPSVRSDQGVLGVTGASTEQFRTG
jgi:hypothetical protein